MKDPKATAIDLKIAMELIEVVPDIMKALRQQLRSVVGSDLTIPQHRILAHLIQGYQTSAELAELQGVSLAAISKMAEALLSKGYLRKDYKGSNRKQIFLRVTAKGLARYQKSKSIAQSCFAQKINGLSSKEKQIVQKSFSILKQMLHPEEKI